MKHAAIIAATMLCALLAGTAPAQVKLPDMGASTGTILSPREAEELGSQVYQQLRDSGRIIADPLLNEYLEAVGQDLAAHDAETKQEFTFFWVAQDSINAFALPGGFIGVHAGLMTSARSEDELAAVLGHEIAHITQQHLLRRVEDMRKMTLPIMLAMVGLVLASGGGDGAAAAIVGGQAAMLQRMINFTRAHEAEADRIGIHTLAATGYDPSAMATFFGRLEQSNLAYGEGPSKFLRTHPVTSSRVAEAKGYAANLPHQGSATAEAQFLLMRARARVLGTQRAGQAFEYYQATLPNEHDDMTRHAMQYGKALTLIEMRRLDDAMEILNKLIEQDGSRLPYDLAVADALMDAGKIERALSRYQGLNQLHGGRYAVTVDYAQALMRANQPEQAESLLRDELIRRPDDSWLHRLYAKAADQAGQPVDARIALAEAYFMEGRRYDAFQQLEQAQDQLGLSERQISRLAARLTEMKGRLTEEELEDIEERHPY